jgi:hypothetical protein
LASDWSIPLGRAQPFLAQLWPSGRRNCFTCAPGCNRCTPDRAGAVMLPADGCTPGCNGCTSFCTPVYPLLHPTA